MKWLKIFSEHTSHLKNAMYYKASSIQNRYPCKIVKIKNLQTMNSPTIVIYQAVNRLNVREATPRSILDDPLLIEKFHPTDAVRLGFLSATEIFLKNNRDADWMREKYLQISLEMFKEFLGDK